MSFLCFPSFILLFHTKGYWFVFVYRHVIIWCNLSWNWNFFWYFYLYQDSGLSLLLSSLGLCVFIINLFLRGLFFPTVTLVSSSNSESKSNLRSKDSFTIGVSKRYKSAYLLIALPEFLKPSRDSGRPQYLILNI